MKKLFLLIFFLACLGARAQVASVTDGELLSSVRTKINNVISFRNLFTNAGVTNNTFLLADGVDYYSATPTQVFTALGISTSANMGTFLANSTFADMRTDLGLVIGTDVQAADSDLTTWAGITPSANMQTFLANSTFANMRTDLGLVIGTDVQAYDADLTTYAGITPSAPVQTFLGNATIADMRTDINLGSANSPSFAGLTLTGALDMSTTNKIVNLADPTANQDAATKAYVDTQVSGAGGSSGAANSVQVSNGSGGFNASNILIASNTFTQTTGADMEFSTNGSFDFLFNMDANTSIGLGTSISGDTERTLIAQGSQANINITLTPKGTGVVNIGSINQPADADMTLTTGFSATNIVLDPALGGQVDVMNILDMNSNEIVGLAAPTSNDYAANKQYVDEAVDDLSGVTNASTAKNNLGLGASDDVSFNTIQSNGVTINSGTIGQSIQLNTTISSGSVALTGGNVINIRSEGGAGTDDLDNITGAVNNQILIVKAGNNSETIVLKDDTGNLRLSGDFSLDNVEDSITLFWYGPANRWQEIARSDNGS